MTSARGSSPFLIEASSLLDRARSLARGASVELYQRTSNRVRVSIEPPETRPRSFASRDEGLAIRLDQGAKGFSFAASSGGGAALDRGMDVALRVVPQSIPAGEALWNTGASEPMLDRERGAALPTTTELREWLEEAVALAREQARRLGAAVGPAWVEAGITTETLVADGGLVARRTRRRTWALALIRGASAEMSVERPSALAGRALGSLPVRHWAAKIEHGVPRRESAARTVPGHLVLKGDAAAALVAWLSVALHGMGMPTGAAVGRAWRLVDDPLWVGGPSGGRFDDAGFVTRPTVLADGERVVGVLGRRGSLRRPSYRDIPVPMFATLVIGGGKDPLPPKAFLAHDLRVLRLSPVHWVLDLWGREGRLRLPVRPSDLVSRCVGASGPPRLHPNGIVTPTLIFDLGSNRGQTLPA